MNPQQGRPSVVRAVIATPWISLTRAPRGKVPSDVDERCLTYSVQTSSGRASEHAPKTYTICLRKVHPLELTDYLLGPDWRKELQQAEKIPLPPEGQPRLLLPPDESDRHEDPDVKRFWQAGRYLWTSTSHRAAVEKLLLMSRSLKEQSRLHEGERQQEEEIWIEEHREGPRVELDGTIVRYRPDLQQIFREESSLIRLSWPEVEPIKRLLAPSYKVMSIFRQSFESGAQQEFARRVWEKAFTREPLILVQQACQRVWRMIKYRPPGSDEKSDV